MSGNIKKHKVAIIYGMTEGRGHDIRLKKSLRRRGFIVSKKPNKADVIIAHSGGAFLIPYDNSASLILLVGMPYWPGRHPRQNLKDKIKRELKNRQTRKQLIGVMSLNTVYTVLKPRHNYRMYKGWKSGEMPSSKNASFVAVRNQRDAFVHHDEMAKLGQDHNWSLVSLPGTHDDIWFNPDKYVDIIISRLDLD